MKITIDTEEVIKYGVAHAFILGYIRHKEGNFTTKDMMEELGYSESGARLELRKLHRYKLINKRYRQGRGRAKFVGADIL